MNLGDLITRLETADPNQIVHHGFHNPHSYRGDYHELAFEPAEDVTVAEMLEDAQSAAGATYEGWKGGHFKMNKWTWCWLSEEGTASGETISPLTLEYMLAPPADRSAANTGQCATAPRVPGPEGTSHLHPTVLTDVDEMAASLARDGFGDDEIANMLAPSATAGEAPEPTLLRWGLDDVMWGDDDSVTVLLSGPAGEPYWLELDPERAAALRENLAGPDAVEAHVVADDSDPEHVDDCPSCEDTLPAWLARRFDPQGAPWDGMSDDDRSYWEHQARAVRRAVARGGFKTSGDEGLSGPCGCGEGAVHYTTAECPAAQRTARQP